MNGIKGPLKLSSPPTRYTEIMLGCIVLGEKNAFPVDFDTTKTIGHLKGAIKEQAELDSPAHKLKLWKVNIPESKKHEICEGIDIKVKFGGEELDSDLDIIGDYFEGQPTAKQIHIIVEPPSSSATTGKRRADDSDLVKTNITKKEKLIDLKSPESIVRFFIEDDENKKWIKTDFTRPHKLCGNEFNFQRKGRDETLHEIFDCIVERYIRIRKALDEKKGAGAGEKSFHPVLALQATPGGGKSFLLDELAALKSEDFDNYCNYLKSEEQPNSRKYPFNLKNAEYYNNVIDMLRNSIAVCITYNGNSSYKYNRVDDDTEKGLVMRILWSYFFDDRKLSWQDFCKKFSSDFKDNKDLDTFTAVRSILCHSKKRVFLCVDETMKILSDIEGTDRRQAKINQFLTHLYSPYQGLADDNERLIRFNFILTTLDAVYVQKNMTDSGRTIEWVPLRRLEISESVELFSEIIRSSNLDERRLYVIKKCIADCNGHPRTLEKFYQVFNSSEDARKTHNYTSLITLLTDEIRGWYQGLSFPVVKMALLGEEMELKQTIGERSISALISSGVYINSLTKKSEAESVIPTLSPVSLQYFCSKNNDNDSDTLIVINLLRNILTTESSFDEVVMDGKPFERFHANWELLYRMLRENGKKISLRKIYGLSDEGQEIQLQRKKIVYCHNEIEFPPDDNIYDTYYNTFENLVDYVFVPKKSNNSGFDMVIFEKKSDGSGYIAINIECKFSYPNKKTTLSERKDISDKYEYMKRKYLMHVKFLSGTRNNVRWEYGKFYDKSAVGKLKMSINDIYLVVVVWRDIGNLGNDILDNENIIIVSRDNLKKIYTPSLVTRPQFYSDELQKIKDIRYEN